ncbi:MAG: peptidase U32 family protein [Candidatus Theseobacter exili]|nr:peptidase U32 family protein [Candidatus Theseobacter exili]
MKKPIELLAPGGDIDSIKAAIVAGADAVYCGLNKFNARNRATNLNFEDLNGILNLAHKNNCKVFLTLNIIIVQNEFSSLVSILNKLINTKIDGVIVQDLGLFYLLSNYFKGFKIHASTQLNTHNVGQINFLSKLSAVRVTLSRELNINEIKALTLIGQKNNISTEVFVHGSYCISFSGICYLSSVFGGKSGNRGKCSQPCRDRYLTTRQGKNYPLNLKDNSAYFDLREIADAGVASIKIEGRIKKFDYVYTVVNCWKKQIKSFYNQNRLNNDNSDLYKVFNRDFSNSYLKGDINKNMFIDNPRDYSIHRLTDNNNYPANNKMNENQRELYEEKAEITTSVKNKINQLSIAKVPLIISISGKLGTPLKVSVTTPDTSFIVLSETNLVHALTYTLNRHSPDQKDEAITIPPLSNNLCPENKKSTAECLNYDILSGRLKAINNTEYYIKHLDLENLQSELFLSFKELTSIKRRILCILNGSKEIVDPIDVPFLKKQNTLKIKPDLAVLISSRNDLYLCDKTSVDIFFQLPGFLKNDNCEFIDLFLKNKKLIPWFPCVLIGENYTAAVEFLQEVQPERIVTNNTGIAYEAYKKEIPWIAGPYLNIVNSFSLLCLKEKLNCYGSFISNEISKYQIQRIINPANFKLYYSIYHPILLLSSRQCLLHQVIGCEKNTIDEDCLQTCNKSSSITNLNNVSLFIEKTKGNYHCIYNNHNFLNTDIVTDLPDTFSGFFIDLRDIKTETKIETDKAGIITLFENLLHGDPESKKQLQQSIYPSTNAQYKKGI